MSEFKMLLIMFYIALFVGSVISTVLFLEVRELKKTVKKNLGTSNEK